MIALSFIFLPSLRAQEGPSENYVQEFILSQMIDTTLMAPGTFSAEVVNMAAASQIKIPNPSFSLLPETKAATTDASRYFEQRFKGHNWENNLFDATLIAHAALNIADYFSTREALKYPGLQEGNPLMKPFVKNDLLFAAVKIGITTGNHFLLKNIYKKNKTLGWIISLTSSFLLSYVVVHNYNLIEKARH